MDKDHLAAAPEQRGELPEPVAWEGTEGWEALAWHLCADENGEDACNELVWEGGPIPEPWGDRWLKYEGDAKRMIELVGKYAGADQLRTAIAAERERNPWRMAIDDALVTAHIGVATDDPYDDLNRLLDWHHDIWLDPAVSSDAQALIDRGAAASEAELSTLRERHAQAVRDAQRYQWLRDAVLYPPDPHERVFVHEFVGPLAYGETIDAAIDAAIAAKGDAK